jgi:HD-GYP domain-containing protein (c-di-GMP phosphodiesterase class II)
VPDRLTGGTVSETGAGGAPSAAQSARLDGVDLKALLQTVTVGLAGNDPPETMFARIAWPIAQACRAAGATLFLLDHQGRLGSAAPSASAPGQAREDIVAIAADAVHGARQLISSSLLALPLRVGGAVLGVLVLSRRNEDPPFMDGDRAMATALSIQVAIALDRARLRSALDRQAGQTTLLHRQLEAYAQDVRKTFAAEKRRSEELARALDELAQTYLATVRGLAIAVEAKDEYTAGHLVRVTRYGLAMMRLIAPEEASDSQLEYGFLLHDIGKLGVPDAVLGKAGPLSDDEWELMKLHPLTGARILERIPFLARAREIVSSHHERWDGLGYPLGLKGEEIFLAARVFPVADAFDAMTSHRPYRSAMSIDDALAQLRAGSGTQFWPEAVTAFLSVPMDELERAAIESSDWLDIDSGRAKPGREW